MSGVLHGVVASLKAAAAAVTDAFFEYVSLLLNTTSTNGAQNNTFLDSSTNAFSITRNGNATQGTFSPFSQTGWSNYFDGTGDFLSIASNAAFDLGSSNFTIEAWVNPNSFTNGYAVASRYNFSGSASGWVLRFVNATTLRFIRGNDVILDATVSASVGVWYHVAVVRNGSTLTIYLNGTQVAQATGIANFTDATTALQIGRTNTATDDANGYTSNLRIVKGTAVYTANFTPPTAPLTAITNTSLLTCQSNRFIDNSSNAFAITRDGDVSVQAFSPFNPTAAWDASTNGGSGYFDGTGDYLTTPTTTALSFGTGDFTVECWVYKTTAANSSIIDGRVNPGVAAPWAFYIDASNFPYFYEGTVYTSSVAVSLNTWTHVAATRSSGTLKIFVNGVQGYSATVTTNLDRTAGAFIGAAANTVTPQAFYQGFMCDLRVVKGTAVYTAAFTPPTAPLTAITNTSLLLNFTNAGIYDSASGNDLETVGNAQVSTVQSKWGTTSLAFDGTGDWLLLPSKPSLQLRNADFTIECWVYPTTLNGSSGTAYGIFTQWSASYGLYVDGTGNVIFAYNTGTPASFVFSASGIVVNTWKFVTVTRSGTSVRCFVDGVQVGTTQTLSGSLTNSTNNFYVGADQAGVSNVPFIGYIDDLRITNGYARYGFFTPPTSALTATAYTGLLANTTTTNGAQNNTFLDGSTNNFSITRNGNTTQGSFSPFSNSGWSNYFDGTGDYLNTSVSPATLSGNFTIEGWVYIQSLATARVLINLGDSFTSTGVSFYITTAGRLGVFGNNAALVTGTTQTVSTNTWVHVAFVRSSNTITLYVDGVADATTLSNSTSFTGICRVGAEIYNTSFLQSLMLGYISNARIVAGTAVYTSNFTPPTAPLTAITNTSLLTCQSNRFIDNSTNNFTITRNGDTSVQAFSPFTPATYSTSTNGGSGYFDGTGDYLATPANTAFNTGTGNFTIEGWVYPTTTASGALTSQGNGGIAIWFYLGQITIRKVGVASILSASVLPVTSVWSHVVAVRSGTTLAIFLNGTRVANVTDSTDFSPSPATGPTIGFDTFTGVFAGYITNVRIVVGSAVYDPTLTTLTVPTSPLTAITNTQLLLNFTNAGIFDGAGANNFETVGNAQASTTQAKYGTTSMYFDGTADRLVMPARPPLAVGSGNFTIEGWVYRLDTNTRGVFQLSGTAGGLQANTTTNLALGSDAGQVWRIYANNSAYNSTATWAINTWYHFALVRSSGVTTLYINGVSVITQADTVNYTGQNLCIGGFYDTSFLMNGYIDDLRVTPGQALYTTNFTPPTAPFPVQ